METNVYFMSDIGLTRNRNEDSVEAFKKDTTILICVADGMGGHPCGDIASKLVIEHICDLFKEYDINSTIEESAKWLKEAFKTSNAFIRNVSETIPKYKGLGTTLLLTLISSSYILIGNVGDSRAYCIDNADQLIQVTHDHTLVAELYRQGEIDENQMYEHPSKNILMQAIGTEEIIDVDIFFVKEKFIKKILLCTDGLTDMVTDAQICKTIKASSSIKEAVDSLITKAKENGGEDNITVALWSNER